MFLSSKSFGFSEIHFLGDFHGRPQRPFGEAEARDLLKGRDHREKRLQAVAEKEESESEMPKVKIYFWGSDESDVLFLSLFW